VADYTCSCGDEAVPTRFRRLLQLLTQVNVQTSFCYSDNITTADLSLCIITLQSKVEFSSNTTYAKNVVGSLAYVTSIIYTVILKRNTKKETAGKQQSLS